MQKEKSNAIIVKEKYEEKFFYEREIKDKGDFMSQEKVNRYKEEKRNRKANMAKEKRNRTLNAMLGGLAAVLLAGWIGVSGYNMYQTNHR